MTDSTPVMHGFYEMTPQMPEGIDHPGLERRASEWTHKGRS